MKIVQSLWSKPGHRLGFAERNKMGWPDKKYNYFSWALSVLQFKKYYNEVELVTDKEGYNLLIDKMQLPYSRVQICLDDINSYPSGLWALGKIYTYNIQEQPFIHADGDVFIWDRFNKEFENAALACQHREEGEYFSRFYSKIFMEIMLNFEFYPEVLDKSISKNNCIIAVNAGLIGGNNLTFFKEYAKKVFEFVNRNTRHLEKINLSLSNIIFEQFLFHALAESKAEKITYFKPKLNYFMKDFADYTGIPERTKFIHTPGALKRYKYLTQALEFRLQYDYPEYYYRIINLIRTNQI